MPTRLCVVGSVNADLTFTVQALPRPGETVLASSLSQAPGGKGGNQAVAAARAGAQVQLVAALGTDAAAGQLRAHLSANSVGLAGLETVPGPSGSAAILVDADAENCIVVAPGANAHLSATSPRVQAVIADSDVVLLSLEIPIETAITVARVARSAGATVVLNASPAPREITVLAGLVDAVVVNETEAGDWLDGDRPRVAHLIVTREPAAQRTSARPVPTSRPRPSRRWTPPERVTSSPGCSRRTGHAVSPTRCRAPALRVRSRHWFPAPVTAPRPARPSRTSSTFPDREATGCRP